VGGEMKSRSQNSEFRIQKKEKKRKSANAVLSLFILASGF
jgi:hypothetical protein